ncbi:MAG: hypothetical protein AAB393_04300, partial [Bacteroidota bacterium]
DSSQVLLQRDLSIAISEFRPVGSDHCKQENLDIVRTEEGGCKGMAADALQALCKAQCVSRMGEG